MGKGRAFSPVPPLYISLEKKIGQNTSWQTIDSGKANTK